MDSMGHGVRSAVVAGLAIGAYRHARREGQSLEHIHQVLDEVIGDECAGEGFVTGQLGRLELGTGSLAICQRRPSPATIDPPRQRDRTPGLPPVATVGLRTRGAAADSRRPGTGGQCPALL
jgi:hypothetical protein